MSRATQAPFLSQKEAEEVLADDQILLLEAMEDDGQEPEEDYDSVRDSETKTDPRIPHRDEFPVPQEVLRKTLVEQSHPLLSKIRQWV